MQHSQTERIWAQRIDRLAATMANSLIILVDPSQVNTYKYKNVELGFGSGSLHAWSINWGYVQHCVDAGRVMPVKAARLSLLLNCTINLKGWAFAYAADLPPVEQKGYTSLITVSFSHYLLPLPISLAGAWWSSCGIC